MFLPGTRYLRSNRCTYHALDALTTHSMHSPRTRYTHHALDILTTHSMYSPRTQYTHHTLNVLTTHSMYLPRSRYLRSTQCTYHAVGIYAVLHRKVFAITDCLPATSEFRYKDPVTDTATSIAFDCWCGVVWCGMVWYGVVWCGMMWYDVVWCGMVWYGVV